MFWQLAFILKYLEKNIKFIALADVNISQIINIYFKLYRKLGK